jgi:hypothetical protein
MIEKDFDIPFIADLALREKQVQQNYRPVVYQWFRRRTIYTFSCKLEDYLPIIQESKPS